MADRARYALISQTAKAYETAMLARLRAPLQAALEEFAAGIAAGQTAAGVIAANAAGWQAALDSVKEHWALAFAAHGYALAGGMMGKRAWLAALECKAADPAIDFGADELVENHLRPNVAAWILETSKIETDTTADIFEKLYRSAFGTNLDDAWTPAQLAKVILEEGLAHTRTRAELMSRTITNWAYNEGASQLYADYGVDLQEWLTTEDDAACPLCRPLNGRKVRTGGNGAYFLKGETIPSDEGDGVTSKIDVRHPPLHPRCRCTIIPVID